MYSTPSRASPHGGAWKQAVVPLPPSPTGSPKLEFYISNGAGQVIPLLQLRLAPNSSEFHIINVC